MRRPPIGALSGSINLIRMDQPRYKFPIQFSNSREKTVIASAAKQSTLLSVAAMDCFAALAMTVNSTHTFALATRSARVVAFIFRPRENRGRGECRVPAAPAASCALCSGRSARVTTSTPESPGIPARNGFNGVCLALPGDRALLPPSSCEYGMSAPGRADMPPRDLTPASGRQDHTIWPSATTSLVRVLKASLTDSKNPPCDPSPARRCRGHRIPHPTSVTIAIRPSCGPGWRR